LSVGDARAAIAWYAEAFAVVVVKDPIVLADRRIGHAELELAGGVLYPADDVVREIYGNYRTRGATVLQEPAPQPYVVSAECADDQGARFDLGEF